MAALRQRATRSTRKGKRRMKSDAATPLPDTKAEATHASRHTATLAPKGECSYCDARRESAKRSMRRKRHPEATMP